jgi:C4-dicarboxylate transporter DctQ subunit
METAETKVEAAVRRICLTASHIAGGILMFLVLVLLVDVFGRFVGYPVLGSYEIVQYGFALVICFSVAYTGVEGAHIAIDLLFNIFPKTIQHFLSAVSELLSIIILSLIVWRLGSDALAAYAMGERSSTLGIPVFFFGFALALGFALLVLVILLRLLKHIGVGKCLP